MARLIRCATVASLDRNARAISRVDSPPTSRRVNATRDSVVSTGWQAVNISRSTSSSMWSTAASRSGISGSGASDGSSARSRAARRKWSIARRFDTAMSQAPGLSGTPRSGHCSRAATSASWARSSASPRSCVIRVSPATSRAASDRQTALTTSGAAATRPIPTGGWRQRKRQPPGCSSGPMIWRTSASPSQPGQNFSCTSMIFRDASTACW